MFTWQFVPKRHKYAFIAEPNLRFAIESQIRFAIAYAINRFGMEGNMIQLGMIQTLRIVKKVEFGVYLSDGSGEESKVLLPLKQVPEHAQTGDEVNVFVPFATVFIRYGFPYLIFFSFYKSSFCGQHIPCHRRKRDSRQ